MSALTTQRLLDEFRASGILSEHVGPEVEVRRIAPAEDCGPGDLVFADGEQYLGVVRERKPAAVVTQPALAQQLTGCTVLTAKNVRLALAHILQRHFDRDPRNSGWERVHPTAVVHPEAGVADSAAIGPRAVIGPRARIGARAAVLAGAVIEQDAIVGEDAVIHPNAVIGWGCEVGPRCIVKATSVIGSEGFGFAQDEQRHNHRIPQLGRVVLEHDVVVGASCCIDRAAFGETRIGAGTVLDNLVHIAHGVQVGEDCILIALTGIAGSCRIGRRVIATGQTGILDHIDICDDTVLLHRAGVSNDIKQPGMYGGSPIQPIKDYMRNQAALRRLDDLRDEFRELKARLKALEGKG
jgi:UDP-3-O-[3-hydroxymyristoyl] glucosamine N-acyltransferase